MNDSRDHDEYGVEVGKLALTVVLSVILTTASVVGLQAFFYRYQWNLEASSQYDVRPKKLEELETRQREQLAQYHKPDTETDTYQIPIDRAMALVVEELSRSPHSKDSQSPKKENNHVP